MPSYLDLKVRSVGGDFGYAFVNGRPGDLVDEAVVRGDPFPFDGYVYSVSGSLPVIRPRLVAPLVTEAFLQAVGTDGQHPSLKAVECLDICWPFDVRLASDLDRFMDDEGIYNLEDLVPLAMERGWVSDTDRVVYAVMETCVLGTCQQGRCVDVVRKGRFSWRFSQATVGVLELLGARDVVGEA